MDPLQSYGRLQSVQSPKRRRSTAGHPFVPKNKKNKKIFKPPRIPLQSTKRRRFADCRRLQGGADCRQSTPEDGGLHTMLSDLKYSTDKIGKEMLGEESELGLIGERKGLPRGVGGSWSNAAVPTKTKCMASDRLATYREKNFKLYVNLLFIKIIFYFYVFKNRKSYLVICF